MTNRLLIFNAWNMDFRTVKVKKNPDCPVCGKKPTIIKLADEEQKACDLEQH